MVFWALVIFGVVVITFELVREVKRSRTPAA
jgi:hypothetical protein